MFNKHARHPNTPCTHGSNVPDLVSLCAAASQASGESKNLINCSLHSDCKTGCRVTAHHHHTTPTPFSYPRKIDSSDLYWLEGGWGKGRARAIHCLVFPTEGERERERERESYALSRNSHGDLKLKESLQYPEQTTADTRQ